MESWRKVWREGVAPLLSTPALEALERKTRRKTARDQKLGDVQAPELTSEDGKDDRESACQ